MRIPDVPVEFIACAEDRVVTPDIVRRCTRQRFGKEPTILPGGHSPFLSRPAALADVLDAIVRDSPPQPQ